ncbi:hypothetical protein WMY93_007352 [Mugilogobius chulae]|uniref:IRF tryptophan pentad repeat domain-containing protein n=1 Tax=Mugilogobius chulae TaxID=88201 RepID=A0AAW0PNW2_9GOBI
MRSSRSERDTNSWWIHNKKRHLRYKTSKNARTYPYYSYLFSPWITNKPSLGNMPVSRMRMRPWLQQMIESGLVPGLCWVDKDKQIFSIPWKHAARHGWELQKDASLFKLWAIHTGKYVEGQTSDPKTWKANFRCAMNSLPDIEEVKDRSINKGHQAMRVFRMLPVAPKCKDFLTADEVPEWSSLVEVGFGSDFHRKIEVSPAHSLCNPDDNEIIEICAQLETERYWMSSQVSRSSGYLSNEQQCTSPGSQYSETSSADELDEHTPQYTTLDSSFPQTDEFFYPFSSYLL